MKKTTLYLLLALSILLTNGCARKTPLANIDQQTLKEHALIIGTLSRNSGKAYFRESSFSIIDTKNKELVKTVFITGKEDLTSLTNPFVFKDDYHYKDAQGSLFAVSIPAGTYYLSKFYTGSGAQGYYGNYYTKLTLKAGDIVYIGDIKFKPILQKAVLVDSKVAAGAQCIITNKLHRDYPLFKKYYISNLFQKNTIKSVVNETSFKLGNYSDNTNYLLFL